MFCSVILSDGHLDHFGFCADPNDRSINVNQPELVLFLFCPECCSFAIAYLPQLLNCFDVILKLSNSFVVKLDAVSQMCTNICSPLGGIITGIFGLHEENTSGIVLKKSIEKAV